MKGIEVCSNKGPDPQSQKCKYRIGFQIYIKRDLYIVIIVEKEVSHYWKYGNQQYNTYSFRMR
jgi:hypothetical protein